MFTHALFVYCRLLLSVNLPVTNLTLAKLPVTSHWMKLVARFSLLEHLDLRKYVMSQATAVLPTTDIIDRMPDLFLL
jgi:hypothetical protein